MGLDTFVMKQIHHHVLMKLEETVKALVKSTNDSHTQTTKQIKNTLESVTKTNLPPTTNNSNTLTYIHRQSSPNQTNLRKKFAPTEHLSVANASIRYSVVEVVWLESFWKS